jgi:hypothetical protein
MYESACQKSHFIDYKLYSQVRTQTHICRKDTDFVGAMTSKVLRDFLFSRNQATEIF